MTKLALKIIAVIAITIGLLIPLAMIRGLIQERTDFRTRARKDIARSWTDAQTLAGPLLVIPSRWGDSTSDEEKGCLLVLPESLDVRASLRTEMRKRGLYSVPVYYSELVITGEFDLSEARPSGETEWADLDLDSAFLALSLSDTRGVVQQPTLVWGSDSREFESGSWLPGSAEGLHAVVGPLDPDHRTRYPFSLSLELRGMEALRFAPIGGDTRVTMHAGWAHPSFVGRFLPVEYEIDKEQFTAEWRVSGLASGRQPAWFGSGEKMARSLTDHLLANAFGVSLIDPVDVYQQAMRSVKYGNLIVLLTFTSFFLVEMVRRLMLHPMQYLLVGLALVIFFLLLLALSEHIPFGAAYLVAALACVGLVAVYSATALGSAANAAGMTTALGGLYGMLYAILKSEDNALLMGSLLLFFALAAVMLVTRRVDWYRLSPTLGLSETRTAQGAGVPPTSTGKA